MLQNLVIVSVIWPRTPKYKVSLSSCEPHLSKCLVVFSFYIVLYITFILYAVLHVKWNLACPITVHFIFLMLPQNTNNKNIQEKNDSRWTSYRSCWSGQRFPSTSHLMFSIAMHRGKISLNAHLQWSAVMSSISIHDIQQRHLILCSMIIYFTPDYAVGNLLYMLPNLIGFIK